MDSLIGLYTGTFIHNAIQSLRSICNINYLNYFYTLLKSVFKSQATICSSIYM